MDIPKVGGNDSQRGAPASPSEDEIFPLPRLVALHLSELDRLHSQVVVSSHHSECAVPALVRRGDLDCETQSPRNTSSSETDDVVTSLVLVARADCGQCSDSLSVAVNRPSGTSILHILGKRDFSRFHRFLETIHFSASGIFNPSLLLFWVDESVEYSHPIVKSIQLGRLDGRSQFVTIRSGTWFALATIVASVEEREIVMFPVPILLGLTLSSTFVFDDSDSELGSWDVAREWTVSDSTVCAVERFVIGSLWKTRRLMREQLVAPKEILEMFSREMDEIGVESWSPDAQERFMNEVLSDSVWHRFRCCSPSEEYAARVVGVYIHLLEEHPEVSMHEDLIERHLQSGLQLQSSFVASSQLTFFTRILDVGPVVSVEKDRSLIPIRVFSNCFTSGLVGLDLWPAGLVAGEYLMHRRSDFGHFVAEGSTVVELGAGVGLLGILWQRFVSLSRMSYVFTDYSKKVLQACEENVRVTSEYCESTDLCTLSSRTLDWTDEKSYSGVSLDRFGRVDVVVGSDVTYDLDVLPDLFRVLNAFARKTAEDGAFANPALRIFIFSIRRSDEGVRLLHEGLRSLEDVMSWRNSTESLKRVPKLFSVERREYCELYEIFRGDSVA